MVFLFYTLNWVLRNRCFLFILEFHVKNLKEIIMKKAIAVLALMAMGAGSAFAQNETAAASTAVSATTLGIVAAVVVTAAVVANDDNNVATTTTTTTN